MFESENTYGDVQLGERPTARIGGMCAQGLRLVVVVHALVLVVVTEMLVAGETKSDDSAPAIDTGAATQPLLQAHEFLFVDVESFFRVQSTEHFHDDRKLVDLRNE